MNSFRLTVPGNLLLAGEYAVTEEGGLGLTMSPGPRMVLRARRAESWILEGLWPGGGEVYRPNSESSGLLSAVWNHLIPQDYPVSSQSWHITVDSSAFFEAGGRKKGFGSSAATAAILSAALVLIRDGLDPALPIPEVARRAFLPAVEAHRAFQGGKGSGYDVAASLFGGLGLFQGGRFPSWTPAFFVLPKKLALVPGSRAVRTVSALGNYRTWKSTDPGAHSDYLEENNRLVTLLAESREFNPELLIKLREISRNLGTVIGVSADWTPPTGELNPGWKALGAGNELILLWDESPGAVPLSGEPLELEKEGLKWEPVEV